MNIPHIPGAELAKDSVELLPEVYHSYLLSSLHFPSRVQALPVSVHPPPSVTALPAKAGPVILSRGLVSSGGTGKP